MSGSGEGQSRCGPTYMPSQRPTYSEALRLASGSPEEMINPFPSALWVKRVQAIMAHSNDLRKT
ncbi:hypothetical protein FOPG_19298 [Fusarium oxysporum f. sp. conglutinans race 2 54008]|uniref:Uncharacterized protein n=1 Tax=Fusarium oxysporum f. sp. conglutinans race 2 54008 TaxID=1089457 RepID=X0GMD2_FUSOX|nr:hypothetical protein FOPG_19298 [Fusarium oxysporum f. sp. conglutinans race 2 54008]